MQRRQLLGADKKVTTFRWMGGVTVGVMLTKRKRETGPKGPCVTRKTRRGQRGGRSVSAVRNAAPSRPSARAGKPQSSRFVNHSGRKHIWSAKAANRLAARKDVKQLIEKLPSDFGHLDRVVSRSVVHRLGVGRPVGPWARFKASWHVYSYKCRHMGAHAEGDNPLHFLALRSPRAGLADLEELLGRLPKPDPYKCIDNHCESCGSVTTKVVPRDGPSRVTTRRCSACRSIRSRRRVRREKSPDVLGFR